MRYLVFSDLHGSLHGLELLKKAVAVERPDVILCLGDILYGAYDGDAHQCADYLSSSQTTILGVRGNCDFYHDERAVGFALPEEQVLFAFGRRLLLRHAPFWKDFGPKDIAMYGHTHVKSLYAQGGTVFLNPGSIGKPRDGSYSYAVLEEGRAFLVDAETSERLETLEF